VEELWVWGPHRTNLEGEEVPLDFPGAQPALALDDVGFPLQHPIPRERRGTNQPPTTVLQPLGPLRRPQVVGNRPDARYWLHRDGGFVRVADRGIQTRPMRALLPTFRQLEWWEQRLQVQAVRGQGNAEQLADDLRLFREGFMHLIERDEELREEGFPSPRGWYYDSRLRFRPAPTCRETTVGAGPPGSPREQRSDEEREPPVAASIDTEEEGSDSLGAQSGGEGPDAQEQ
jgi:hypothetical protein